MSLWYSIKLKFSRDSEKYCDYMNDILQETFECHGLHLMTHDYGCLVKVEVFWDVEGAESDYKKLSLGIKGVGSVEKLKELYTKPDGYLY